MINSGHIYLVDTHRKLLHVFPNILFFPVTLLKSTHS
ncbi:unnamed protein product [Brugia timori]|uniref:Uncharacterized protein n=1 Tax=Brugia timori TaxID=42155 RepID=A0A0R3QTV9_9BILA|nr:unnamed protein product [Brugia timori]